MVCCTSALMPHQIFFLMWHHSIPFKRWITYTSIQYIMKFCETSILFEHLTLHHVLNQHLFVNKWENTGLRYSSSNGRFKSHESTLCLDIFVSFIVFAIKIHLSLQLLTNSCAPIGHILDTAIIFSNKKLFLDSWWAFGARLGLNMYGS